MSQIKSNKVTGRTPTGTLTIGEPGSTVQFDPDATVLLNDYATKEYVDLRTPNLGDVNFDNYYNKNEIDAIVEEASNDYLQLTGGRMSGPIAVEEGNTITMNVGDPDPGVEIHDTFIVGLSGDVTREDQAINKAYLDFKLSEAGQGDALEYRLETDANLRSTPSIQLVDNNDMFSDVSMIAGANIEITSAASSMNFKVKDSPSFSNVTATGTITGNTVSGTTVAGATGDFDKIEVTHYIKEYVREQSWSSSAVVVDYTSCPTHLLNWDGSSTFGMIVVSPPSGLGFSVTVMVKKVAGSIPYSFDTSSIMWAGGEAPEPDMSTTGSYDVYTFMSTKDDKWLGFVAGKDMA